MTVTRVLVRAIDNAIDPNRVTVPQKGDIVSVIDAAESPDYSAKELENNVGISITNGTYANHVAYRDRWRSRLNFHATQLDAQTDTWKVELSMTNVSASGYGTLTKQDVDRYLTGNWNITPSEVSANNVEFTADVYDVARSPSMFGMTPKPQLSLIAWSELAYRSVSGEHDIEGDYSAISAQPSKIERAVGENYTIIEHDVPNKKISFTADRSVVFDTFKREAQETLYRLLGFSIYRISDTNVDAIAAQPGRTVNRTQAQVSAALIDKRLS